MPYITDFGSDSFFLINLYVFPDILKYHPFSTQLTADEYRRGKQVPDRLA